MTLSNEETLDSQELAIRRLRREPVRLRHARLRFVVRRSHLVRRRRPDQSGGHFGRDGAGRAQPHPAARRHAQVHDRSLEDDDRRSRTNLADIMNLPAVETDYVVYAALGPYRSNTLTVKVRKRK